MYGQSDDEEDEEYYEAKWLGKDGIIFMIDATTSMFAVDKSGECPFRMCLRACEAAMQHKIKYSNLDIMSVVFFGTETTSNDSNLGHISILQELKRPSAPSVKQLKTMHESTTFDEFNTKYGHNEDYLFSDVLWLAHSMFGKNTIKLASSRILLLTCSEVPGKDDPHSKRQAITRAKDLRGGFISLDIIPCSVEYHPSDFIKTIMSIVEGHSGSWSLPQSHCIYSLEDIPKVVETIAGSKDQCSRCLGHIPFKIGEEVVIDVELYKLVSQSYIPKKAILDRVTNDVVKPTVNRYNSVTKEVLMSFDIAKYQDLGGEKIKFAQEEIHTMKRIVDPGLVLLGFIPVSLLKKTHYCSPASFVHPDKSSTSGAKDLFAALWLRIGAKKVAAVCSYTLRLGVLPRFVALIPAGMSDENGTFKSYQKHGIHTVPEPQGFHLFYLPFADNINSLGLPEKPSAYPEQVECAIAVLKKLRVIFHPSLFPNPVLETHWAAIEALALERSAERDVIDEIKPNYDEMDERLGKYADKFLESVYPEDYDPQSSKSSGKRASSAPLNELNMDVVEAAKQNNKVETLTVDILKGYLKAKGKPVSGKRKADLVADVYSLDG